MNIMKLYHCRPFIELLYTTFNINIWANFTYTKVTKHAQEIVSFLGVCNRFLTIDGLACWVVSVAPHVAAIIFIHPDKYETCA